MGAGTCYRLRFVLGTITTNYFGPLIAVTVEVQGEKTTRLLLAGAPYLIPRPRQRTQARVQALCCSHGDLQRDRERKGFWYPSVFRGGTKQKPMLQ